MKKTCAFLVITGLSSAPALADSARQLMNVGIGTRTCADFEDAYEENKAGLAPGAPASTISTPLFGALVSFADGFITGHNMYGRQAPMIGGTASGRVRWLDNYCRAHPLANFLQASDGLTRELMRDAGVPEDKLNP